LFLYLMLCSGFTPTVLENKLSEHLAFFFISLYLKVCGIAEIGRGL